jgi:hypothetical protein
MEDAISCSTSATSIASGSSGNATPAFANEDSRFSDDNIDDKMSVFVDEDSRSLMDTLPPPPSDPQISEPSTFAPTPTPGPSASFGGALERDSENTPFEIHPIALATSTNSTLAAVKQNLRLGSCEIKHAKANQHPHLDSIVNRSRPPLQSLENLVQERFAAGVCSSKLKEVVLPAKVRGRGRSYVVKDTDELESSEPTEK